MLALRRVSKTLGFDQVAPLIEPSRIREQTDRFGLIALGARVADIHSQLIGRGLVLPVEAPYCAEAHGPLSAILACILPCYLADECALHILDHLGRGIIPEMQFG